MMRTPVIMVYPRQSPRTLAEWVSDCWRPGLSVILHDSARGELVFLHNVSDAYARLMAAEANRPYVRWTAALADTRTLTQALGDAGLGAVINDSALEARP